MDGAKYMSVLAQKWAREKNRGQIFASNKMRSFSTRAFELTNECRHSHAGYPALGLLCCLLFVFADASVAQVIKTVAGTGVAGYSGDGGPATSAQLRDPYGLTAAARHIFFIGDTSNNRVRKVDLTTGIITTVAGTGVAGYSGDGGLATSAQLNSTAAVAVGSGGNLFIADQLNHRVRRVDLTTGIITTVAGTGLAGFSGDGGPATSARLNTPSSLAVDGSGNLFIGDRDNSLIRKVALATGTISTVVGVGGGQPSLAVDSSGNLFLAEFDNHRVRKINLSTSMITTVAGTGVAGFSGDGGPATSAQLKFPRGVSLDSSGNIFISDGDNHRVRKVDVGTGIITTVAGTGVAGFSGDGGPATSAQLKFPHPVAIDECGGVLIGDLSNQRVRAIKPLCPITVAVDIKPGSFPNSINLCSGGTVPIAILGSDKIDVNDINTETLRFAEAAVKVVGKKDPHTLCSFDDVNSDGFVDLVCHFITADIAALDGESSSATVNGELLGGPPIAGTDSVSIVKDTCQ